MKFIINNIFKKNPKQLNNYLINIYLFFSSILNFNFIKTVIDRSNNWNFLAI